MKLIYDNNLDRTNKTLKKRIFLQYTLIMPGFFKLLLDTLYKHRNTISLNN